MIKTFASPEPDEDPFHEPGGPASFKRQVRVSGWVRSMEDLAEFVSYATNAGAPGDAQVDAYRLYSESEIKEMEEADDPPLYNPLSVVAFWPTTTPAEPTR